MRTAYIRSIDDLLGDRKERYFGDGYAESRHSVLVERGEEGHRFTWSGAVTLPRSWSSKAGVLQSPHLSTIDVIELAHLCWRSVASESSSFRGRRMGVLQSIRIVAGGSPVEGDFSHIPLTGIVREQTDDRGILDLRIANMDVTLLFSIGSHESGEVEDPKKQKFSVRDVLLHTDDLSAESLVASAILEPLHPRASETWSPTSCFAAALQLGQALLYELDEVQRSETNTLWMKRTSIVVTAASPRFEGPQPLHVRLEDIRRYTKADGDWRRADVIGLVANMKITCSVTHRLPDRLNR